MSEARTSGPSGFHCSPLNFDSRVTGQETLRPRLNVLDVTLREGQQAAEVAFSKEEEITIARFLEAMGVPAAQVGYAGADDETIRAVKLACPRLVTVALLVGWQPDALRAIDSARDAGLDICSILFRSTDRHLANLGYTREEATRRIAQLVSYAAGKGFRQVAFGPSFGTAADLSFLLELYRVALDAGAGIISLADSMGVAKPATVRFMVGEMRRLSATAGVRVHTHDDFGLALANTLAAAEAGADWLDASINGLGERAGNCALDELVVALEALYGVDLGIDLTRLYDLSRLVEGFTGVAVPPMKPIVGENCFANKLEIHVRAARSDPGLMEPYDPTLVGNRRRLKLGRGSGPEGVKAKLAELGLNLRAELLPAAVEVVNRRAVERKRAMSDDEFRALVAGLGPGGRPL